MDNQTKKKEKIIGDTVYRITALHSGNRELSDILKRLTLKKARYFGK